MTTASPRRRRSSRVAAGLIAAAAIAWTAPARADDPPPARPFDQLKVPKPLKAAMSETFEGWPPPPPDDKFVIQRHLGRAALMNLAVLSGGTIWYWANDDFNSQDWSLRWDRESWRKKLFTTEVLRFDTNDMNTNAGNHLTAGAVYYLVGRANGLGLGASWALNVASDFVWEYAVEFREYPSVNDLIVTGLAGPTVGEPLLQIGRFFKHSLPTRKNRVLAVALAPIEWLTGLADARAWPEPDETDDRGLTIERGHVFQFTLGERAVTFNDAGWRRDTTLMADLEVMMQRGYGRPGRWAAWARTGAVSRLALGFTYLEGSHLSTLFRTKTTVGGFYWQDIRALDENDFWSRRGYSLLVSAASGFEYETRRLPAETDRRAVVNVLGPHLDWSLYSGRLAFRWELGAYGDFAMVDSYALGPEFRANPTPPLTTAIRAHGYYYATGATAVSRARLDYRRISFTAEARANHFVSIDGLDRERSPLDDDLKDFTDQRLNTLGTVIVRPWGGAFAVAAYGEWIGRRGTIGGGRASRKGSETSTGLQLMWAP
jgi:hypothetical protein